MQMQHRHTIETHAMSGVYIYVIEHTYNVGVHILTSRMRDLDVIRLLLQRR